jgi:hypothetical protein
MKKLLIPMILLTLAAGCDDDRRLVQLAQEADNRQAQQNNEMARQNQHIAEATKQLVEADSKSRQEMVAQGRDLQAERAEVGRQRDALEADRRTIASQRQWDSLVATAIDNSGLLLVCVLPLLLCLLLLNDLRGGGKDEALGELLTIELTAKEPSILLPSNADLPPTDRLLTNELPNEAARPAIASGQDDDDLPF